MHLDIMQNPDYLDMIASEVVKHHNDAPCHLVVSHGRRGLLMSCAMKEFKKAGFNCKRTSFHSFEADGVTVRFAGYRNAMEFVIDRKSTCVYSCDQTNTFKGKRLPEMLYLFESWRSFHSFYAVIDCSMLYDGTIRKIVAFNDGQYDMHPDGSKPNEVAGDHAICRRCGNCIGTNTSYNIDSDSVSDYDAELPLRDMGRVMKERKDESVFLYGLMRERFKNVPDGVGVFVNKSCPYYAEHLVSGLK